MQLGSSLGGFSDIMIGGEDGSGATCIGVDTELDAAAKARLWS